MSSNDHSDAVPAEPQPAAQVAEQQQSSSDWPKPGDEGYVHPDGSEQSRRQLAENRQAAADRAAAGSTVHGAPLATPGPQAHQQAEAAAQRAEDYDGTTAAEAEKGLTEFVEDKSAQAVDEAAQAREQDAAAAPKVTEDKRTATTDKGKTTR